MLVLWLGCSRSVSEPTEVPGAGVRVAPTHARPGDLLTCAWDGSGEATWTVGERQVGTGPTLDTAGLRAGDSVTCAVRAPEGRELGHATATLPGNVLIVLTDDTGIDRFAAYGVGQRIPRTPTVDRLVADGVLFERAWGAVSCSPGRAELLTGRRAHQHGVQVAQPITSSVWLHDEEVTLPEMLRQGTGGLYSSAFVGKWHLASRRMGEEAFLRAPLDQGFDHAAAIMGGLGPTDSVDGARQTWEDWVRVVDGVPERAQGYVTDLQLADARTWFDELPEPFLLVVATSAAHAPYVKPPPGRAWSDVPVGDTPQQRGNHAAIEALDRAFGELLEGVDPGRLARTTVFFTSDNGTDGRISGIPAAHAKGSVFEIGLRVPLVVSGLGVDRHGEHSRDLVGLTDLYATVADLAGVSLDDGVERDTASFRATLRDAKAPPARTVLATSAVKNDGSHARCAARDDRYKVVRVEGEETFYDLDADPGERVDLPAASLSAEAESARERLTAALVPDCGGPPPSGAVSRTGEDD
ncbi:MAG: sulfatase-like hydrolase/transferase [Myxococcales bacterium]|nr:sulfatase-like hydrolase/transferase [Myxococcales bacterium]